MTERWRIMNNIETEKYIIRQINENDMEDLKALLKENKYLAMLWTAPRMTEEDIEYIIKSVYITGKDNYCIIDKQSGKFCGYMSAMSGETDGELSVRLRDDTDMGDVIHLFGMVLKDVGPLHQKNLTIQYNFE